MKNLADLIETLIFNLATKGQHLESGGEIEIEFGERELTKIAAIWLKAFRKQAPVALRRYRRASDAFRRRHNVRWRRPIDQLEIFCELCSELGAEFNEEYRPKAVEEQDMKFEALVGLHARGVLIAHEVLCLLQNGFADGALSRWRSLHEITVVASFLSSSDPEIAEKYLESFHVQAYKAIRQHQEHAERANLEPFSQEDEIEIKAARDHILKKFGENIDSDYGWAATALGKKKPNFYDIEKATGLDHWRPRYKWASHYMHANFKPRTTLLGVAGMMPQGFLVGQSNSGLTDPAHMMAVTLQVLTTTLILERPTPVNGVMARVLAIMSDQIGEAFLKRERRLMEWHQKKIQESDAASDE